VYALLRRRDELIRRFTFPRGYRGLGSGGGRRLFRKGRVYFWGWLLRGVGRLDGLRIQELGRTVEEILEEGAGFLCFVDARL